MKKPTRGGPALQGLVGLLIVCALAGAKVAGAEPPDRSGTQWSPYLQWTIRNDSYEGDPHDVRAAATFVHAESGQAHTTELFYDGENAWKFRFTGTRLGNWTFSTASQDDPELDGHRGTVAILPNPDPHFAGFLTHAGNKFAIQRGPEGELQGYLFNVYMGRVNFDSYLESFGTDPAQVAATTRRYLAEARDNGCEILFVHVNHNWLQFGQRSHQGHKSVHPDRTTFQVLETVITTAHRAGGRVHLWMWGDEQRGWTPIGLPGGINGPVDRRLQRYLAARLGPLPGWSMGYGFDLHEWVSEEQVNAWASHLQEHLGWPHLLSARAYRLNAPNGVASYETFARKVPLTTTTHGPRDLAEVAAHVAANQASPSLYEERHTYQRPGYRLDMDGTRRLLWWQAMAGGMGGFIGFYDAESGSFGGHPYPHPEQLRTHYTFWHTHRRFRLDMQPTFLASGEAVLQAADGEHIVVYREQADTLQVDLSGAGRGLPAVAVDTKRAYDEIDLGTIGPGPKTLALPRISDWVVAIGQFADWPIGTR